MERKAILGIRGFLFLLILSTFVWNSMSTAPLKAIIQAPVIITREEWGARPPNGNYTPHVPDKITVHHTATSNDYTDAAAVVRAIQNYHIDDRGWVDIAYHYLIDKEGKIYQGRPDNFEGNMTGAGIYNTGNIYVSVIGNYEEVDITPTIQTALENLIAWLCHKYSISPDTIKGHKDYAATLCPGQYLYARLPDIRAKVKEMLTEASTVPAKKKAVWFGLYTTTWTKETLDQALTSFKNAGIEIIFLLVKVPWGGPTGNVYFNSSYVPMALPYDWDCLAYVVEKAHEKGMEVHPYLNIFEDGYFVYNHPEMAMIQADGTSSTTWVSPAYEEVRNHQINIMKEVVQKYDVDGIHMDRIRFPNTNYDYNPEMKRLYKEKYGTDPSPGDPNWTQFRKDMVSNLTRDIYTAVKAIKPHVKFSAAVFPSPETAPMWQLQDWPTWVKNGWLDLVVTMAYTSNLNTLKGYVSQEMRAVDCLMPLYVGLGAWLLDTSQLRDQLNAVNITGVDGVAFFSGQWLFDYPAHLDVIKSFSFGSLNITLGVLNTTIAKGENVTVSGSINSHLKGVNVTFTYKRPDGSLVHRTALTNSCGIAVDAYRPDAVGTWNVSASFIINGVKIESQVMPFLVKGPSGISATVDIDPDTLNLKSRGKWTTCYITLPEGYNVSEINNGTILLNDTIPAEWTDIQDNVLMAKFNRAQIIDLMTFGNQTIKITGELTDGTPFEGTDMIRGIHQSDLSTRMTQIDMEWACAPPSERPSMFLEIIDIDLQWPYAPP